MLCTISKDSARDEDKCSECELIFDLVEKDYGDIQS